MRLIALIQVNLNTVAAILRAPTTRWHGTEAVRKLIVDENFVTLLRAEGFKTLPQNLAARIEGGAQARHGTQNGNIPSEDGIRRSQAAHCNRSYPTAQDRLQRYQENSQIQPLFGKRVEAAPNQEPHPAIIDDADLQLSEADDVVSGNKLLEQERFDEALMVFLRNLERWNRRIPGRHNMKAVDDRDIAVEAVSKLILGLIQNREFKTARNAIDQALVAKPHAGRACICLAHILMLTGKVDEARTLYLKFAREVDATRLGANIILEDFAFIREAGLTHDLMDEVEKLVGNTEKNVRV